MKKSSVLISQRTFERRVKARLEQIRGCEDGSQMDVEFQNADAVSSDNWNSNENSF